jgi:hypothetical protein
MRASAINHPAGRSDVLGGLAAWLPEPLLREALEVARAFEEVWARSDALARLALRVANLGGPEEALELARTIDAEDQRSLTLAWLAPHLSEPLVREALKVADVMDLSPCPRRFAD